MRLHLATILVAAAALATPAQADPYDGFFIAEETCPAFQSFNNQTNPGNIMVQVGHSYRIIERLASSSRHIIPGHDPLVMRQYPAPEKSMEGIVIRLDVEPREVAGPDR